MADVADDESGEVAVLLCPACGYDLRGTDAARCSECGLEVDREALKISGVPWAHRRTIGRVRAYLRTAWRVTADHPSLRHEAARAQDPSDGRWFHRVTATLLAATLLTIWAWILVQNNGQRAFLAWQAQPLSRIGMPTPTPWLNDLMVPWSAGATLPWVIPLGLVLLAVYMTRVQRVVLRAGATAEEYRRRVAAAGYYLSAPLALMLPVPACLAVGVAWADRNATWRWGVLLLAVGWGLTLVIVLAALGRAGQWAARARHGGFATAVLAAAELLFLWGVGAVLSLWVVPWCVGFLWIVVDSFR